MSRKGPNDDEITRREEALHADARAIVERQDRKIAAFDRVTRRLTWLTVVLIIIVLGIGGIALGGALISSSNNRLLHESEFAFCAAGLPPPALANTPTCKRATELQQRKSAQQVAPFATAICEKVLAAERRDPARCRR